MSKSLKAFPDVHLFLHGLASFFKNNQTSFNGYPYG